MEPRRSSYEEIRQKALEEKEHLCQTKQDELKLQEANQRKYIKEGGEFEERLHYIHQNLQKLHGDIDVMLKDIQKAKDQLKDSPRNNSFLFGNKG